MKYPQKIAFVHIPKTAGSYVFYTLNYQLFKNGYIPLNSIKKTKGDWTDQELDSISNEKRSVFIHNHIGNWTFDNLMEYKNKGWFLFSFIRHPGDRLCSDYYFGNFKKLWGVNKEELPLDEFIRLRLLNPGKTVRLNYWKHMDYIEEFTDDNFKSFLKEHLGIEEIDENIKKEIRKKFKNENRENRGYKYYCKKGIIKKSTQLLLERSNEFKYYKKIINKTHIQKIKTKIRRIMNQLSMMKLATKKTIIEKLLMKHHAISHLMQESEIRTVLENLQITLDNNINGDIVELGCNVGTTSLFIQRLLRFYGSNKTFHVYDSFEGLPEKTKEDKSKHSLEKIFKKGFIRVPKEELISNFKIARLTLPKIHKGWFKNIPNKEYPKKISFAFLDGDFYSSIIDSFNKIYHKLSKGGIMVIDDYGWDALPGVEKAVKDFLANKPEKNKIRTKGKIAIIEKE